MPVSFFAYVGLTNAITAFALGCYVLIRNFHTRLGRAFFYFMFAIAYWCFVYFLWLSADNAPLALFLMRSAMAGVIFIPTMFTYFVLLLAEKEAKFVNILNFSLSFLFLIFLFSDLYIVCVEKRLFFPFWPVPGSLFHLGVVHFFANIIGSHFLLWKIRGKFGGTKRTQVNYFFVGAIIGFSGGCTNYFIWYNILIPPYFSSLISVYVVMLAYAVFRHRMLEPDEVFAIHREKLALMGLLSSSINHEIKNPLFLIQEFARKASHLESVLENQELTGFLGKISEQTERIAKLAKRIDEFGKPRPSPGEEDVALSQVIDDALFFASRELEYRSVELTLNLEPNLPKLQGDKSQFEEIFLNLIVNAYHAMPKGGQLTIAANTVPNAMVGNRHACSLHSQSKCVEITIADTGTGIRKHDLKDIFKPFYTTKTESGRPDGHSTTSTTAAVTGTGLGLYIVKTLVEQNHGTIQVESEVGKGTTFTMKFGG